MPFRVSIEYASRDRDAAATIDGKALTCTTFYRPVTSINDTAEMVPVHDLVALSRGIAEEVDPRLAVIGVASTDADAARAEILVTITGCHDQPCAFLLNANRSSAAEWEAEFRDKLVAALHAHRVQPA